MNHSHSHTPGTHGGHDHHHGLHAHAASGGAVSARNALVFAFVLNLLFLFVEVALAVYSNSLALMSDAVHMLGDVAGLALALFVAHLAALPATSQRSFGYIRAETLGALANASALLFAAGFIVREAIERFIAGTPGIPAWPVLIAGVLGFAVNVGGAWALYRSDRDNLNVRGALVHLAADALGSVGAIVAAIFMFYKMPIADTVVSILIAALVAWGAFKLLLDSLHVLMEFTPRNIRAEAVQSAMCELKNVAGVHDLHIWTLDGRRPILSAHLLTHQDEEHFETRRRAEEMLAEKFGIGHTTLQVDAPQQDLCDSCPLAPREEK